MEISGGKVARGSRINYREIHKKLLPLEIYPIPTFIPHNPLSWISIGLTILAQYIMGATSHPAVYEAQYSTETRRIQVTDPKTMRALWEMGFFGKGSLSRSEPNWLALEKRRLGLTEHQVSEELTQKRRVEREKFKRDRQREQLEAIEAQKLKETGELPNSEVDRSATSANGSAAPSSQANGKVVKKPGTSSSPTSGSDAIEILPQEHLQLSQSEAFFLVYGLGVLKISNLPSPYSSTPSSLLQLFRQNSYFPSLKASELKPDDPFLTSYVVYHHFRSLGWVVRDGVKFAVDYLLYRGGPVFQHAQFGVVIIPEYTIKCDWDSPIKRKHKGRNFTWFHCVNRVQTNVLKTLVLVYVHIPDDISDCGDDITALLSKYSVREYTISRWSANRNRD